MRVTAYYLRLPLFILLFTVIPVAMGLPIASMPLTGLVLILLTAPPSAAITFVLGTGILMESLSPFPPLMYFSSLLATAFALRVLSRQYLSSYTIFGAGLLGFSGVIFFQILLLIFSYFSRALNHPGWMPIFNSTYLYFIWWQAFATMLVVAFIFAIIQRVSPKTRGTIITQHPFYRSTI